MEDANIQGKNHIIAFTILCVINLLLTLIDLLLPVWISYCWWDFGLISAKTNSNIVEFDNENFISDVYHDACGDLRPLVERSCPNACNNIENFEKAGVAMMVFGVISLCTVALNLIVGLLRLWKFRVRKAFAVVGFLPLGSWFVGISIYAGLGDLGGITGPNNLPQYNFEAYGYQMNAGIIIAIIVLLLDLLLAFYSFFKIKKLLQVLK
jgi:hypothetical protein